MRLVLDVQRASRARTPSDTRFRHWVRTVLQGQRKTAELSIRIVTPAESRRLNARYRKQDKPTNVLSFPCRMPAGPHATLGDLVICASVVAQEAMAQGKHREAHWAHMTVHGLLHLLGYDHQKKREAERMESLETRILARLGYPDPYEVSQGRVA